MASIDRDNADLQETLDRVAATYDDLPYSSVPITASHPARMAAIAQLFGLEAPPVETARILELGCASGGNCIPHAAFNPEARVLGLDIGRRQVEDGQARIARLGLKNAEIRQLSVTEIGEDIGEFDFIISHGLYSWVPEPVREAVLRVSRERLAPNGIAYVSYNVLPGWRVNQLLRDTFQAFAPATLPPHERVGKAREILDFLTAATTDHEPYGRALRSMAAIAAGSADHYLFHDYMEETNHPLSFRNFVDAAGRQGLAYLGEGDLPGMFPENVRHGLGEVIRHRAGDDRVAAGQLLDHLTGQPFRRTLLVAADRAGRIDAAMPLERLEGLHFTVGAGLRVQRVGNGCIISEESGASLRSGDPAIGLACERLVAGFPGSLSLDDCAAGMAPDQRRVVADVLMGMIRMGMVQPSSVPLPAGKPGPKPRASWLARSDAAAGVAGTTNPRHENVALDPLAQALLPALDGGKDRAALEKVLLDAVDAGTIRPGEGLPGDAAALRRFIRENLEPVLGGIAAAGLLEPE